MPNDGHAYTEARRHALRALLASADLSALLVTKPANVRYLTGFTGSYGALLLLHDRPLFFTDGRYRHQAAAEVPGAEVVLAAGDLIGAVGGGGGAGGGGLGGWAAGPPLGAGTPRPPPPPRAGPPSGPRRWSRGCARSRTSASWGPCGRRPGSAARPWRGCCVPSGRGGPGPGGGSTVR